MSCITIATINFYGRTKWWDFVIFLEVYRRRRRLKALRWSQSVECRLLGQQLDAGSRIKRRSRPDSQARETSGWPRWPPTDFAYIVPSIWAEEKMINTKLKWYLEKEQLGVQASSFLQSRIFYNWIISSGLIKKVVNCRNNNLFIFLTSSNTIPTHELKLQDHSRGVWIRMQFTCSNALRHLIIKNKLILV